MKKFPLKDDFYFLLKNIFIKKDKFYKYIWTFLPESPNL